MSDATWYLGPLGDMRALPTPDTPVNINQIKYGGIHQGLSGARVLDITGFRTEYGLDFRNLDQEEFLWLEALHYRMLPGPFYLIDPLKRNRLTAQASRLSPAFARNAGVTFNSPWSISTDWPTDVRVPGRSLMLASWVGSAQIVEFDTAKPVPIMARETLTGSVWLKASGAYTGVLLRLAFYDRNRVFISNKDITIDLGTDWAQYWYTYHDAPTNAAAAKMSIVLGTATQSVYIAAPMLEAGATFPSPWEIGGGAPLVFIDEIPVNSGRFPLRNVGLKLMEA